MEDESTEQTDDHRPESTESGVEMDVDDSLEDVPSSLNHHILAWFILHEIFLLKV